MQIICMDGQDLKLLVNVFKWLKQKNYQNLMKTS